MVITDKKLQAEKFISEIAKICGGGGGGQAVRIWRKQVDEMRVSWMKR